MSSFDQKGDAATSSQVAAHGDAVTGKKIIIAFAVLFILMDVVGLIADFSFVDLIRIALTLFIFYYLSQGDRWARILATVLNVLGLVIIVIALIPLLGTLELYDITTLDASALAPILLGLIVSGLTVLLVIVFFILLWAHRDVKALFAR